MLKAVSLDTAFIIELFCNICYNSFNKLFMGLFMVYDIAVIGGGAAGLVSAIYAAQKNRKLNIVVLESLSRVGKKLITTGNGRCNITNKNASKNDYHSEDVDALDTVFGKYFLNETMDFFSNIGIEITFENDGRAYPYSYQASSVVDALRFACEENKVEIKTDTKVSDFSLYNSVYSLSTENEKIMAKSIIIATGLFSGGNSVGSDGSFYNLLKKKGFKTVKTTPSIVQIKADTAVTKQLKGIKTEALATLLNGGETVRTEKGEVLFTDYGLSGPPILQISREVSRKKGEFTVLLDLMYDFTEKQLTDLLYKRRENLKNRNAENFLTGLLNKRVGQTVVKLCGINLNSEISSITDNEIIKIAKKVKNFDFSVVGTTGFNNSQVTAGGIALCEFDKNTLQSKRYKGMFAAGEILDVDGDCGGYNLQWAWSSAMLAADSAVRFLGGNK